MDVKYLMVDGNNLLYRAHFATTLNDKKGRPVSGTMGVMRMTRKLISRFRPQRTIIAWDEGKSQERLQLYPEYKANRAARDPVMKANIVRQMKDCQRMFYNLPVRQVLVNGIEADDIIGILCEKLKGRKVILSNDQDFVQLVSKSVSLYLPKQEKLLNHRTVDDFIGFPVKHYVLWKSMVGDSSDNIKGIMGIGPKKATGIIRNGLTGKKKLPINPDEMAILDRNKYLITIGAVLQPKQIKKIKTVFKKEQTKWVALEPVRRDMVKLGLKQLSRNFDDWSRAFLQLKKNERDMKWARRK